MVVVAVVVVAACFACFFGFGFDAAGALGGELCERGGTVECNVDGGFRGEGLEELVEEAEELEDEVFGFCRRPPRLVEERVEVDIHVCVRLGW